MKLQIATSSYNARRYGKPWIARVDFTDSKGTFHFGDWCGQPGDDGLLLIEVEPGDVVSSGQKDFRGHNGTPTFAKVLPDGTLSGFDSKADAYRYFQGRLSQQPVAAAPAAPAETVSPLAGFSSQELIDELKRRGVSNL